MKDDFEGIVPSTTHYRLRLVEGGVTGPELVYGRDMAVYSAPEENIMQLHIKWYQKGTFIGRTYRASRRLLNGAVILASFVYHLPSILAEFAQQMEEADEERRWHMGSHS